MYLVEPQTKEAKNWINDNVQIEPWQLMGNAFAVDHHYIEDLVQGMVNAGLKPSKDFNVVHC